MHIPLTQTIIEIDGTPVEIKARKEDHRWSVISFTPAFSIRSNKLSLASARRSFAGAVVFSIIDPDFYDSEEQEMIRNALQEVEDAILKVTNNFGD